MGAEILTTNPIKSIAGTMAAIDGPRNNSQMEKMKIGKNIGA